jgi:hypothetical protein
MPDRWPPALEIPRALNDDPASKTDEWFRVYHPEPIEPNQVDEVVIPDT